MNNPTDRALQGVQRFGRTHRVGLIATLVALMGGFGITAVAVAPMVEGRSAITQRLITENVEPAGIPEQLADLAAQDLRLIRSDITRGTDTAPTLLARLGIRDGIAAAFIRSDAGARLLLTGRGGKMVQAHTDAQGGLQELVARFPSARPELAKTHFTRLTLARIGERWTSRLQSVPYGSQTRLASGSIRSTLFAATDESGLPDGVAGQIAEIFATDLDFHRELRKGDTFSVVYEALTADGEPVAWDEGAGRIQAAEFVNGGKVYNAVWFATPDGRGCYFNADGRSKKRSFLASPMEFSRVTSGFAMRFHPLLQNWRQHNGVDYGAPTGTPVRSVGDGTVEFAGRQNGYGNVVEVKHSADRSTLYAHLSRVDVKKGQHIEQGARIGAVGSTGWATGPHLHFEFRIAGHHQDPLSIAKASDTLALDGASRQRFAALVQNVKAKLDVAETLAANHGSAE